MITLQELRENNKGCFLSSDGINEKDLKIVNDLIEAIESSRTNKVQTLDCVEYTDKYGDYYPNAMAEFNTYYDNKFCIIQSASCHIDFYNGKLCHSVSGGSFDSDKKINKFIYKGTKQRTFWTWSSYGAGASQGLYFTAEVSNFIYNERAEELKHLTTKTLTKYYISDYGKDTREQYRYSSFSSGRAWKNEKELNSFLTKYHAIEESRSDRSRVIWTLNPVDVYCFDRKEFEEIKAPEFITWWNGSDRPHKEVIKDNDLITYIDRSNETRYKAD